MTIYGQAHVAGVAGTITHASLGANSSIKQTGITAGHSWNEYMLRDPATGKPIGFGVLDEAYDLTIEWIPVGTTNALAAGALPFPAPYSIVTISGAADTDLNDTWLYVGGGSKRLTADGNALWTMNLKRYRECDDSAHTALATQAS